MKRVIVIGSSCSGKTTFACRLGELLGSDHIELDALHWGPGWSEVPVEEFRTALEERIAKDRWVVDGNYSAVRDIVWGKATDAVWLNYRFPVVFGRALARTLRRIALREEVCNGNRESLKKAFFSRDSILLWILTTFRRRRRVYRKIFDEGRFPPSFAVRATQEGSSQPSTTITRPVEDERTRSRFSLR